MNIAVITTFPNNCWNVYAEQMLQSFTAYWPKEIPLLVALDDDLLLPDVEKLLRPKLDGVVIGWTDEHKTFVDRNKDKDDPNNYRKQPVRFCHKVFAIYDAYMAAKEAKESGTPNTPRYLIWMDADVVIAKPVTMDDIKKCLPKEGDAVAYLGRKDWEHSECGWLAFDLEADGDVIIQDLYDTYKTDMILAMQQQHDSWAFDQVLYNKGMLGATNLTKDKPGMEIWPQSPMAAWSIHYKGPAAKQKLLAPQMQKFPQPNNGSNFVIQTKNAIPNEEICKHIEENQRLIKNWITECEPNDETIVVVSAGPTLIAEDVRKEVEAGRKIIAVKHALVPLKKAGIKPWASILLDPRPHVIDFVKDADPDIKWFIASQVNPAVTKELLLAGCDVWGYHASVGANEQHLTVKQPLSIIGGGSATATRGLFTLAHLGFRKFKLYGYDLSFPDKPDLNARDNMGQPKYMEFSMGIKDLYVDVKKHFFSEPQLIAQYEEMRDLIEGGKFEIEAVGDGLIPFMLKYKNLGRLREAELKCKMGGKLSSYKELWNKTRKTRLSTIWRRISLPILRKQMVRNR